MKKSIFFTMCITHSLWLLAQNVGFNTAAPAEKLTVRGNLLVTVPVNKLQGLPELQKENADLAARLAKLEELLLKKK